MSTKPAPTNPEALRAARDAHDRCAIALMRQARHHMREALTLARRLERATKEKQQ